MTLGENVAELLCSAHVSRINLRCGPTRVWGAGYRHIAASIQRRPASGAVGHQHRVQVESNAHVATLGCGNYNENLGPNSVNKMMLPFSMMRSVQDRGVAVHEATHALQDWNGRPMSQADSECAAYIAHMMYGFLATGGEFPLEVDGQLDMQALAVFQESWTVARRLATERGAYIVTDREQRSIEAALRAFRPYRGADRVRVVYDGI